ncbi:hypothetical protein DI09_36p20 [Mitosporidium daphniae]|uniref:Ribosome biogenesis protein RLP24 n=1 Tax=Mitosporidium daphniae TaxID=1485682 RepID=A0A098VUQ5_9MICR|nr:uncharacterized protein DI09_36p20 [Mitosporidium daphniae]KGG51391.1 hypothetical protein DI09_36p20 [Mitosporidium daphniae]|eukprot:XP_013237835.1 uncharacterized protein DI09_36p20 [Mitosporidium daphniae]
MKRNPRKVRWTKAFRKVAGKELIGDSVFEFEKRRNVPLIVDVKSVEKTIEVMEKVQKIKSKREMRFYENRMAGSKALSLLEGKSKEAADAVEAPLSARTPTITLSKKEIAEKISAGRKKKMAVKSSEMDLVMN